ncbi:dolichol-phosphate mannose synthase subunit [Trifolium repens]|nr:dolichol-phosphate mannose synthase subunit [Trifolium repens]
MKLPNDVGKLRMGFEFCGTVKRTLRFINEAYCKDFDIGNCHHCVMGWPSTNFCHSTKSYLVASNLFCRIFRMLWSIDGWSWSDEFSYLSSRSPLVAKGIFFYLCTLVIALLYT